MTPTPHPDEIERCMELTGMDYIQARNHLIGRELAKEAAQRVQQRHLDLAAHLARVRQQ